MQFPNNLQNHNRYSYVMNNPLSHTDPTGYFLGDLFRPLASIAISIWLPGAGFWTGSTLFAANGVGAVAVSGFVAGAVASGNLKGAAMGAFSAAAFHGIGGIFEGTFVPSTGTGALGSGMTAPGLALKSAFHGFAGGVMGVLQGGKFGHGFLSGFATQAAAGRIGSLEYATQRTIGAAVLGGTVSAATVGKFVNGAVTAAFSRAVSERQHRWRLSQRASFGGEVNIATGIAFPDPNVGSPSAPAGVAAPGRDVSPPLFVPLLSPPPDHTQAHIEFSGTGGALAPFDRQQGLEGYAVGGIRAQDLRGLQLVFAGPSFAVAGAGLGAYAAIPLANKAVAAGTLIRTAASSKIARLGALGALELNSAAVSFTHQFVIQNAARQIPSAYVRQLSTNPGPRLPYRLVQPK